MPKNRVKPAHSKGKSVAVLTKFKIGGRKSASKGAKQLSNAELETVLAKVSKRDRNKLTSILQSRGLT